MPLLKRKLRPGENACASTKPEKTSSRRARPGSNNKEDSLSKEGKQEGEGGLQQNGCSPRGTGHVYRGGSNVRSSKELTCAEEAVVQQNVCSLLLVFSLPLSTLCS